MRRLRRPTGPQRAAPLDVNNAIDSTCQHDHWRRGHKQMCKKIHRGGNAEQYHADKKYKEAVAVAVEARGRHEGPDVLHLHPGPPLEDEGGSRARVCVPRDGGVRARVVPGGAGEDFGRGGRKKVKREVGAVGHV